MYIFELGSGGVFCRFFIEIKVLYLFFPTWRPSRYIVIYSVLSSFSHFSFSKLLICISHYASHFWSLFSTFWGYFWWQKVLKICIEFLLVFFVVFLTIFVNFGVPFGTPNGLQNWSQIWKIGFWAPGRPQGGARGHFWVVLGSILGPFWDHFGTFFGPNSSKQ